MTAFLLTLSLLCGIIFYGNGFPYRGTLSRYLNPDDYYEDYYLRKIPKLKTSPDKVKEFFQNHLSWFPMDEVEMERAGERPEGSDLYGNRPKAFPSKHPKNETVKGNCPNEHANMKQIKSTIKNFTCASKIPVIWATIKVKSSESVHKVHKYINNRKFKKVLNNVAHPLRYRGPYNKTKNGCRCKAHRPRNHPKSSHVEVIKFGTTATPSFSQIFKLPSVLNADYSLPDNLQNPETPDNLPNQPPYIPELKIPRLQAALPTKSQNSKISSSDHHKLKNLHKPSSPTTENSAYPPFFIEIPENSFLNPSVPNIPKNPYSYLPQPEISYPSQLDIPGIYHPQSENVRNSNSKSPQPLPENSHSNPPRPEGESQPGNPSNPKSENTKNSYSTSSRPDLPENSSPNRQLEIFEPPYSDSSGVPKNPYLNQPEPENPNSNPFDFDVPENTNFQPGNWDPFPPDDPGSFNPFPTEPDDPEQYFTNSFKPETPKSPSSDDRNLQNSNPQANAPEKPKSKSPQPAVSESPDSSQPKHSESSISGLIEPKIPGNHYLNSDSSGVPDNPFLNFSVENPSDNSVPQESEPVDLKNPSDPPEPGVFDLLSNFPKSIPAEPPNPDLSSDPEYPDNPVFSSNPNDLPQSPSPEYSEDPDNPDTPDDPKNIDPEHPDRFKVFFSRPIDSNFESPSDPEISPSSSDYPESHFSFPRKIKVIIDLNSSDKPPKMERNVDNKPYLANIEGDATNSTNVLETAGEMASDLAGKVTSLWHCVLGSHRIPDTRDVKFYLYTRRNIIRPELLTVNYDLIRQKKQANPKHVDVDCYDMSPDEIGGFERVSDENREIIRSNFLNIKAPTKILIHGYTGSYKDSRMSKIKDAYLTSGRYNVIQVDWEMLAAPPCYIRVTHHSKFVGETIAQFLDGLYMAGLNMSMVHLVGFSLGAQVAGFAGNNATLAPVCRITGLDPALPLFLHTEPSGHLDRLDAKFVDVIHTCGGILAMLDPLGHVDFYPNGGTRQPGCEFSNLKCSHSRAPQYFAESIASKKKFTGQLCRSWEEYVAGSCKNSTDISYMGEPCSRRSVFGKYYLLTRSKEPFVV